MLKMPLQTTHFTEGNSDDQKVRLTAQEHTAYNYRVKTRARTSSRRRQGLYIQGE